MVEQREAQRVSGGVKVTAKLLRDEVRLTSPTGSWDSTQGVLRSQQCVMERAVGPEQLWGDMRSLGEQEQKVL